MKKFLFGFIVLLMAIGPANASREFTNNTANYLNTGTANNPVITLAGWTVLVWVKTDQNTASAGMVFNGRTDSGSSWHTVYQSSTGTGLTGIWSRDSSSEVVRPATAISTGVWTSVVCVFKSGTNEAFAAVDTWTNKTNATLTLDYTKNATVDLQIGRIGQSTPSDPFDGLIAHVAMWDTVLSDADKQSLIEGADPDTIGVANQQHYWPLTTTDLTDQWGTADLTVNGTVAFNADNPTLGGGGGVTTIITVQDPSEGIGPHKSQTLNGVLEQ